MCRNSTTYGAFSTFATVIAWCLLRGPTLPVSAALGGATALAVTGAEVASTVTAGTTAAVAVGAVAADVVFSMAMMDRTIGVVASRYRI